MKSGENLIRIKFVTLMTRTLPPDGRMVTSPVKYIFSPSSPSTRLPPRSFTPTSPFPMNTPLAGESPASTHRSTYEDQSPFANPSYPSNFRKSYSSNNRETPATPTTPTTPSTDRLQTHSNRREKWLTNHSPSNHNHNHDKTILQPTRHILSQQEEYQDDKSHVIYSEDNKHCQKKSSIAGHEDDDQYFFETPKFILYAMRSYCLSKPCQKFKALFMQYDENSDGQLDTQEIHNGILRMGFEVPLSTAEEVMKMIDLDGNAQLDFAEVSE